MQPQYRNVHGVSMDTLDLLTSSTLLCPIGCERKIVRNVLAFAMETRVHVLAAIDTRETLVNVYQDVRQRLVEIMCSCQAPDQVLVLVLGSWDLDVTIKTEPTLTILTGKGSTITIGTKEYPFFQFAVNASSCEVTLGLFIK
ncbi:hypothetical protein PsorP6_011760 [Peronosclerospora sorghi]|uniref:Uncharacterized protein n=1 Tax=Peronosclerospora sorghi TaxID=230839 RepID=A0ACC0WHU7_9STRA|nr:hypothetical protein PsorP6_011760 [Peronosclerospora sorghi]